MTEPLSTWLFVKPFGVNCCVNCACVPGSAAAARSSSGAAAKAAVTVRRVRVRVVSVFIQNFSTSIEKMADFTTKIRSFLLRSAGNK